MMNDSMNDRESMYGYVISKTEDEPEKNNFSWTVILLMLFVLHNWPSLKIESISDFKKAVKEFNDRIQAMDLSDPEAFDDED